MIGKALDSNNDLIIENGSFKIVDKGAEVVQHVRTRLLTYLNEWFLDRESGVPYFEQVFIKPVNLNNVESILKTTIIRTPGVSELTEFQMVYNIIPDRKIFISFAAETIYGTINNEEVTINV